MPPAASRIVPLAMPLRYSAGWARCATGWKPIDLRFSGRLRVSASTMPMETAMAISEEPP